MTRTEPRRRAPIRASALLAGGTLALAAATAAPALAQETGGALAGCWEPQAAPRGEATRFLCVVPAAGGGAEITTVDSGRVVARTPLTAAGERRPTSRDGCTGWESARLAAGGARAYLRSEYRCPGGLVRTASGLLALGAADELLDIQSVGVKGPAAVRVGHFRPAAATATLPAGLADAAARGAAGLAASTARAAAAAPVTTADVVDASRAVEPGVLEAWLVERQQRFALDAKALVALADAGVPGRVTDMMIALSHPRQFAVNPATGAGEPRPAGAARGAGEAALPGTGGRRVYADMYGGPFGYGAFSSLYGLGYGFGSAFGYGPGYGWYPGGRPVIVVRGAAAPDAAAPGRVRAVNGRGYTRDPDARGGRSTTDRSTAGSSGGGGGRSSGGEGASSGGSSGGGSGRTAKPRP